MSQAARLLKMGRRPTAMALVAIVIAFAVFVVAARRYHGALISEARERSTRLSFILSEQAARTFESVDFTLRGFEPIVGGSTPTSPADLDELLRKRASELSFVQSIRVINPDGSVSASSDPEGRGMPDPGCYTALSPDDAPPIAIGCTAGDVGAAGRATITVARRVVGADGRLRAILVAGIDPGYFSRFFADLDLGRHAVVTLTENHGHVLLASAGASNDADARTSPTLVPPTDRSRLGELQRTSQNQITATHNTDGYPLTVLVGIDRGDVEHRWWQVIGPMFALAVAIAVLMLTLAAVVERHRAERARASQRAAVAQKLEAMGQMTASVAHDFRNILTALGASIRLIGKRGPEPTVIREATASLARGNAMVDRLLAFSRRQDVQLGTHDINALLSDLDVTLRHIAGHGHTFSLVLGPGPILCRLDRLQFDAAMMNLVNNARQAMHTGGTIAVTSRTRPTGGEVSVEDTGCGIDPATLKRVFEPFFTTKAETGTGLGLAQVQDFVKQIDGHVTIDSSVGRGTIVRLHMPGINAHPVVGSEPVAGPDRA